MLPMTSVKLESVMEIDIQAVAFDLDNTLWDVEPVIERAESALLEWLQEHCPRIPERLTREDMRAARAQLAVEEPHRAHDFTYVRIAALARHARECGYDESIAERAFEIFFAARNRVVLYPDVLPSLERLRARFRLASLSNGNADLGLIGIAGLFEVSLSARAVGVPKPHPRAFEALARGLGVPKARILFVGDDPDLDVHAPRAVGMKAAWINRRDMPWPERLAPPDIVVRDCAELVASLDPPAGGGRRPSRRQ